ncbi:hypothetical protein ACSSS7_000739 [Eimeria intestinalis]
MASPQSKAKVSLLKSAAAKPSAAPAAKPLAAEAAAKGGKKQLTLKERQQQQQELRERLLQQQQQQGKGFTAPKLKAKFVSKVKQPVAALDLSKKPAAAPAKPAAPAAAAPAAAPTPPAAAAGKAAAPPAKADGKQPPAVAPAAAAKPPVASAAATAKPPLAAAAAKPPLAAAAAPKPLLAAAAAATAAKPPLAAAAKEAAASPPLVELVEATQPKAPGGPAQRPNPHLAPKGAPGAPLLAKEASKPAILPKKPPGGALLQPKETPKPAILPKGPPGAPIAPEEAPKQVPLLPKKPPGALLQPKEAPKPAILPKGPPRPPGPPLPPKEAPKITPKTAPKSAVDTETPKASEDVKKAASKESAFAPPTAGKTPAAAAGKAGTPAGAKLSGKGPAPKKSLAELLGGDKKGPAPKKTLAELLGTAAPASTREKAPSGGPSSTADKGAASDKQQAAAAEAAAAAAAAAIAVFAGAHPEEFAAALAPVPHLKAELIKRLAERYPQIPEAVLATALKKLPGADAAFVSLRVFLGQRWGQERVRLLESDAGKRAPVAPPKDGEKEAPKEAPNVGALRANLFKPKDSMKEAEGGPSKKEGAGGPVKKDAEGGPPKKEGTEGPPKKEEGGDSSKREGDGTAKKGAEGGPPKKEIGGPTKAVAPEAPKKEEVQETVETLTAEALARRALVAMPKICEAKAWQEGAEVYAGKAVAERELARLKQQQQQQKQQQDGAAAESWLTAFPTGLPQELKADLEKRKPNYPEKAVMLLQDGIDVERLQVLLPVLVESNRYLALLLRTAEKQRELQRRAGERQQQQQKEGPSKKGGAAAAAAAKDTRPTFLKRDVPAFLAKTADAAKGPPKPKEEAGASQLQSFAAEVSILLPAFPRYLIVGAAKMLSPAAVPPVDCPLLSVLLRKEEGHFVHLLLVQRLLLQLPGLELLHLALSCSACKEAVDVCLRKTLAGLPFQAEDAFSDIEYWFNAIRFFFQAACQVLPINRLRDHRGAALALKKARETFPVTADGMEALVCITLDRLSPLSIAASDFAAPMRHRTDSEQCADITLGDFVAEYRKRARVKGDALASVLCSATCDEDLASLLLLKAYCFGGVRGWEIMRSAKRLLLTRVRAAKTAIIRYPSAAPATPAAAPTATSAATAAATAAVAAAVATSTA